MFVLIIKKTSGSNEMMDKGIGRTNVHVSLLSPVDIRMSFTSPETQETTLLN